MVGKPFSIQAPEEIAKEYGGNKQKIAQAAQLGVVDPTAALLAGMFIDRMRSAQVQEMTPQQSVAQQVMGGVGSAPAAGPPVAGGLGALPPEAPPMAPGAGGLGAMPQGAPPGMADGGYVAPYMAGGGLSDLPVPDTMFDEPSNGGYADGYGGGGIVAFAAGDKVTDPLLRKRLVGLQETYEAMGALTPSIYDSQNPDIIAYRESLMPNPEKEAKQRSEDKWLALAQIGASLASSQSPYFLQALGQAGAQALPMIAESTKAQRQAEREALRDRAKLALEDMGYKGARAEKAASIATSIAEERLTREKLTTETALHRESLNIQRARLNAAIEAAKKKGIDEDTFLLTKYFYGKPEEKTQVEDYFKARYGSRKGTRPNKEELEDRLREGGGKPPSEIDFSEAFGE